jgi:FKBP-type peptidyl-prolyl cis-trans isomerase
MKLVPLPLAGVALALAACSEPAPPASSAAGAAAPPSAPALETPEARFSYSLGARLGSDVQQSGHAIESVLVLRGFADGLSGSVALSPDELAAALQEGVERRAAHEQAESEARARAAEEEGRAFLARNREREGVVELPSGVQYEVLRAGSGATPGAEEFVTCHSRGELLDGTVFDDSAEQGRPRTFAVSSVVDGLEEALLQMQPGARWKIWVPAELAYGARGARPVIPPHSALHFEVELLSIGSRSAGAADSAPHPG